MSKTPALLETYLLDVEEILQEIDILLVDIEESHFHEEVIDKLFRLVHTLKGSSSFIGFNAVSDFAHEIEDILDAIRSGALVIGDAGSEIILEGFSLLKAMIEDIRKGGNGELENVQEVVKGLSSLLDAEPEDQLHSVEDSPNEGRAADENRSVARPCSSLSGNGWSFTLSAEELGLLEDLEIGQRLFYMRVEFSPETQMKVAKAMLASKAIEENTFLVKSVPPVEFIEEEFRGFVDFLFISKFDEDELREMVGDVGVDEISLRIVGTEEIERSSSSAEGRGGITGGCIDESSGVGEDTDPPVDEDGRTTVESQAVRKSEIADGSPGQEKTAAGIAGNSAAAVEKPDGGLRAARNAKRIKNVRSETIRVDIGKFDRLMNLAGELVTNRTRTNDLASRIASKEGGGGAGSLLMESLQLEGKIVSELQEGIMESRMIRLGRLFSTFPPFVREMAKKSKKSVECMISGEDTELDKKLVDGIKEPLVHLIRNAIDHGIEPPEQRELLGKRDKGLLHVSAFQEYNTVVIQVTDDGYGIDRDEVVKKAIEKGFLKPGEENELTDRQVLELLFSPGFSTVKEVTSYSGRGVGMDAAKKAIEDLNGSVEVTSEPGRGTTVSIRLPLTLAIIQGLLVMSNERIFIVPIVEILEIIRFAPLKIFRDPSGEQLFNFRGEVISLHSLGELLGIERDEIHDGAQVIIMSGMGRKFGIAVDSMIGRREVVIKSLRGAFLDIEGISGASIMGDGKVILILDVAKLLKRGPLNGKQGRKCFAQK